MSYICELLLINVILNEILCLIMFVIIVGVYQIRGVECRV